MTLILVTTRYAKEDVALLEIGDALFPYDNKVSVSKVECHRGILLIKTKLSFNDVIKIIKQYPPYTVERLIKLDRCFININELISDLRGRLKEVDIRNKTLCLEFKTPETIKRHIKSELGKYLLSLRSLSCKNYDLKLFTSYVCGRYCYSLSDRSSEFSLRKYREELLRRIVDIK